MFLPEPVMTDFSPIPIDRDDLHRIWIGDDDRPYQLLQPVPGNPRIWFETLAQQPVLHRPRAVQLFTVGDDVVNFVRRHVALVAACQSVVTQQQVGVCGLLLFTRPPARAER